MSITSDSAKQTLFSSIIVDGMVHKFIAGYFSLYSHIKAGKTRWLHYIQRQAKVKKMDDELLIDYPTMIDEAMRSVVRQALRQVEKTGELPGEHHFFITFDTNHPQVKISKTLHDKYPNEMTIVLQHQFWDLKVEEDRFHVTLSFNKRPEQLSVPFSAMTAFADPSIKFGLQFHLADDDYDDEFDAEELPLVDGGEANDSGGEKKSKDKRPVAEVISIDTFRK